MNTKKITRYKYSRKHIYMFVAGHPYINPVTQSSLYSLLFDQKKLLTTKKARRVSNTPGGETKKEKHECQICKKHYRFSFEAKRCCSDKKISMENTTKKVKRCEHRYTTNNHQINAPEYCVKCKELAPITIHDFNDCYPTLQPQVPMSELEKVFRVLEERVGGLNNRVLVLEKDYLKSK